MQIQSDDGTELLYKFFHYQYINLLILSHNATVTSNLFDCHVTNCMTSHD